MIHTLHGVVIDAWRFSVKYYTQFENVPEEKNMIEEMMLMEGEMETIKWTGVQQYDK